MKSWANGGCAYCGAEGQRWAQFPWGTCQCCDACMLARGGERFEPVVAKRMAYRLKGKTVVVEEA